MTVVQGAQRAQFAFILIEDDKSQLELRNPLPSLSSEGCASPLELETSTKL